MRSVSNPRKRRRTESAQTTTPDENRRGSRNARAGDDGSLTAVSTVPRECSQTLPFTPAIVEHVPPLQHALYWSSKISSVFIGLARGLSSLSPFRTSNHVRDLCPEHVGASVSSSEDTCSSGDERCVDGYESSVSFGEQDSACHCNDKALHILKRQLMANKAASELPPSDNVGEIQPRSPRDSRLSLERCKMDLSPADVDNEIMEWIRKPQCSNKEGDVYVFKQVPKESDPLDLKSQLLKIGATAKIHDRKKTLRANCNVHLVDVEGDLRKHLCMMRFERAERLALTELWNFRYKYPWPREKRLPVGYTEWFLVDEEIALRVVQRWRYFLSKNPYDKDGKLKDYWRQRLDEVPHPGTERYDDHESRHIRWDWFVGGDEQAERQSQNSSTGNNKSFVTPQTSSANITATSVSEDDATRVHDSVIRPRNPKPYSKISTGTEGTSDPCRNFAARHWGVFCSLQCFLWFISTLKVWPYFDCVILFAWLVILWVAFK